MCAILPVAMAAVSIAGAAAQHAAQQSQANAAGKYQNKRYNAVSEEALGSYGRDLSQLSLRDQQESVASAQAAGHNRMEADATVGTISNRAAAAGVSGKSVNAAINEFRVIEWENDFNIWRNRAWQSAQIETNKQASRANAQSRISGAAPQPIQQPSSAGLVIAAGSGVMAGINSHVQSLPTGTDSFWTRPLFG